MRATRYDRYRRAQNADHFAHNSPFSAFFAEVVCTLGMTPPRTAISPPPKGVCTTSMESTARPAGPGCGTRGLRCPWAATGPGRASHSDTSAAGAEGAGGHGGHGRASRRRAQPRTATQAPPVWRVPTGPEGCGARLRGPWAAAGPGRASRRRTQPHTATQAPPVWRVPEGTEGQAAVPMGGARPGRASRRRAQPHTATQAPPVWRVPEGPEGQGGLRDRPLRAVGSRVAISRAAGPDGTRNTDGTTSKTISQVARRPRAHQAARPQHTHSDACPHTIQA